MSRARSSLHCELIRRLPLTLFSGRTSLRVTSISEHKQPCEAIYRRVLAPSPSEMAADPTYPLYPIIAFLGFVLALTPLPWHFQSWNSGTCYYMVWTALACLNQFINSIVWANNAINVAPVWCDICMSAVPYFAPG